MELGDFVRALYRGSGHTPGLTYEVAASKSMDIAGRCCAYRRPRLRDSTDNGKTRATAINFATEIHPIITKRCTPCHAKATYPGMVSPQSGILLETPKQMKSRPPIS